MHKVDNNISNIRKTSYVLAVKTTCHKAFKKQDYGASLKCLARPLGGIRIVELGVGLTGVYRNIKTIPDEGLHLNYSNAGLLFGLRL